MTRGTPCNYEVFLDAIIHSHRFAVREAVLVQRRRYGNRIGYREDEEIVRGMPSARDIDLTLGDVVVLRLITQLGAIGFGKHWLVSTRSHFRYEISLAAMRPVLADRLAELEGPRTWIGRMYGVQPAPTAPTQLGGKVIVGSTYYFDTGVAIGRPLGGRPVDN